ncbi:MAG: peptide deformylase [Candidatus Omnitrophica bacterium]|nr:peptide deformylase [Candidatus Omnitrophota bacterium]
MGSLEIKIYPAPCLRIKTKPVKDFNSDLKSTLRSMAEMMYIGQGIGLAAPQVGLDSSMLVIDIGEGLVNLVNPVIIESSRDKSATEEGCLSLPGIQVKVARPNTVKVRAQNEEGKLFEKNFSGLYARVVQHEMDHLDGKLIIDYLDPLRYFIYTKKLVSGKIKNTLKNCEVTCDIGKRSK